MKNFFFFFLFIFYSVFALGQLTGDGSAGNPWRGTLVGDATWSGTKYINGDITVDNELLTINSGAIIVFVAEGSDLIITNTGQLIANGSSENMIRFTADDDNNAIYGESGERWGHIVFWEMDLAAVNSSLEYCIIEYGDVSGSSNTTTYGGGLFLRSFSGLSLSNCIIRNNKATHGGGIMALKKDASSPVSSPTISNCDVSQNTCTISGGGIYLHTGSNSIITNCLVSGNATGIGGGGGIFLDGCANVRVINSNFVNNTTTVSTRGYNVQYYNISSTTDRPRFINCITWGSENSIAHITYPYHSFDFINSAIRDVSTPASSYTYCVNLSSLNNDPLGPNFTSTDGSDWSITNISPCIDAGTDSYAGVTIPLLDYIGNGRVRTTDIGAYENYLSRWKTTAASTDWTTTGNWDGGVPATGSDVIIPSGSANYPTGSPGQDFTIGTGRSMTLETGSRLTLNSLTNNGVIRLNSSAAGFASLILNSYTRGAGGTEEIQLFLTGGGTTETFKWHYISTPVSSLDVSVFAPGETQNLAQWIESRPTGSLLEGWVAYDGYIYPSGTMGGPQFSTLTPGKGYDYYDESNHTFTFGGSFNTADVPVSLGFSGTPSIHGFNLLGNPFPSGLDWDYIISQPGYPASTSKSLYFTRDNKQCSYVAGVGIPDDVNGIIPPMQGFFNKTYIAGNSITLPLAARTHNDIHERYKGKETIPLLRLSITDNSMTDETVVRFDNEAKADLDFDFDAVKMTASSTQTYLYTLVSDVKYSINGQPFPEDTVEIELVVNVTGVGTHTISATQVQGLDGYNVTLTDRSNSFTADLKKTPQLVFTAPAGTLTGRFVITVSRMTTGIEDPDYQADLFNIYHTSGMLNIRTLSDAWDGKTGSVRVLDLTGKTVTDLRNAEFNRNSLIGIPATGLKGVYFVEMRSGVMRYVGKVIVK